MYTVKITTSIKMVAFIFIFFSYIFGQEDFATTSNLPTSNDPLPNIPTISGTTHDAVDVKVFESSTRNQAEPTIAVNPVNGLNFLAGAYTGDQGNKKLGYYYSLNGPTVSPWLGLNDFPVSLTYSADPVAAFDADGAAYYCYLTGNKNLALDRIEYYTFLKKSTNGGATWDPPTQIPGSLLCDKPWLAIDQTNGTYKNRTYVAWTDFSKPFSDLKAPIKFWSSALPDSKIISDSGRISQRSQGVSIATGPNGEVYCVWAGYDTEMIGGKEVEIAAERRLVFNKSIDGGTTWATSKKIVDINGTRGEWDNKNSENPPQPIRVNSFPSMAVDVGDGIYKGAIYVVYAQAATDRSDIYFIKSTDQGTTWGSPMKINIGGFIETDQWFPAITVNPYGVITAVFYDSREDANNQYTSVWAARSTNGGSTWSNFRISDVQFMPVPVTNTNFMGDYISITSQPGKTVAIWNDTREGNNPNRLYQLYTNTINTWSIDQAFPPLKPKKLQIQSYNGYPKLTWIKSPEPNVTGTTAYKIYRNSQFITSVAQSDNPYYVDESIRIATGGANTATYSVRAVNTQSVESVNSDPVSIQYNLREDKYSADISRVFPSMFELQQNHPNPFNPTTTISYSIPVRSDVQQFWMVTLKVYNVLGREVATLVNEEKEAGKYSVRFDASNLSSGIYLAKMQSGNNVFMQKMVLLK